MRRWSLLILLLTTIGLAGAQNTPKKPKKPAATKPVTTKSAPTGKQTGKQSPEDRARALVPGLGGAPPKKTVSPPLVQGGATLPGKQPAQVMGPGQSPGLPALPGLQSQPVNPMLYGADVAWGDNGGITNWDKDGGAKARRLAQLIKAAGITNTRVVIRWSEVEKVRGKYDWRDTDRFINYVSGLGVTPICLVNGAPDWSLSESDAFIFRKYGRANLASARAPLPLFYPDLGRFANACALRYKAKIKRWEFWNEPDGTGMPVVVNDSTGKPADLHNGADPKTYTALLTVFSKAVKKADPTAQVAVGGLQIQKIDFLSGLYANGAKPYFDAVALHPYADGDNIAFAWIDKCRDILLKNGDTNKSFWLTEWGWPTGPGNRNSVNPLHQARLVRESLAGMRDRPFIAQASYHTLNDWRTTEADPNTVVTMGLTTYNMTPKPAYFAFRELATGALTEPARRYSRVNLVGGLPLSDEGGVRGNIINVNVDADRPGAALPPLGQGYVQSAENGGPDFLSTLPLRLKALGAKLVRMDPFPSPDAVKRERVLIQSGDVSSRTPEYTINWQYPDEMIDTLEKGGAKPVINFGTMPSALSSPTGNTKMPRDLTEWTTFIQAVVRRYNVEQKRGIIYWELSNEPNRDYTLSEWLRLYEAFAKAVTGVDPKARVGGPSVSNFSEEWLKGVIDFCAQNQVPLNFVTWHAYDQAPSEYGRQVAVVRSMLERHPALRETEIIVSEWNASSRAVDRNDSSAGATHALSVIEQLADAAPVKSLFYEVKEGRNFRTPNAELSGRWGLLTWNNKPKPVYNAFRLLGHLGGARLQTGSEDTGIHALATREKDRVSVLVWRDDADVKKETASDKPVRIRVRGLPWSGLSKGSEWLVDGSPAPRLAELDAPATFHVSGADVEVPVVLSPNSMTLLELTPAPPPRLEISLDTPKYIVYGGSAIPLTATVHNLSAKAQTVTLSMTGSDASLIPAGYVKGGSITMAPGDTRSFSYALHTSLSAAEGRRSVKLSAGDAGEASTSVKIVAPLNLRVEPARADVARPGAPIDSSDGTARMRVVAENRSETRIDLGLVSDKTSISIKLPPRQTIPAPIVISAPSKRPGNYQAPIKALLGEKVAATLQANIGVPALCRYAAKKPRINGDLSEWTDAYPLALDIPGGDVNSSARPTDFSAQALTMWDEENFYLAVVVTEPALSDPLPPEEMWRGSSVLFAFDTRRNAPPDQDGYREGDYEFGMAKARLGAHMYRFFGGQPGLVKAATVVMQRLGTRTIYEAAIPWSELRPAQARAGSIVGFSILASDRDGQGRRYLEWAGGIASGKRPGQFIGLRLIKD